jgi:hypothetical protein
MADNRLNTFLPNRSVMGAKMLQRPAEPYLRQQAPEVYGALSGLMGTAPDQQGSVLDPNTARARAGAEIGFPLGTALQMMPFAKPAAAGIKALGPTAGRMAEGYLQRQGLMPNIVPEAPQVPLGSMIEKPQAPVSPLGFYSAAEQAALNIPRKSGTGQSFMNDLMKAPDVKKDELSWIGLDDFLKDKPNVTKQEVQDFISANRVDVQERQLGGKSADQQKIDLQDKRDNLAKSLFTGDETVINGKRVFDDELGYMLVDGNININQLPQAKQAVAQEWVDTYTKLQNFQPEQTFKTRYERYQLPGGENYREILLTMPDAGTQKIQAYAKYRDSLNEKYGGYAQMRATEQELQKLSDLSEATSKVDPQYRSSHFNEPNILAHMRVNDRVDADGKKMLLIEEVQSDWHQAGREKGYQSANSIKAKQEFTDYSNELANKYNLNPEHNLSMYATMKGMKPEEVAKYDQLQSAWVSTKEGVPDAPFKDSWHQLALKRALKYAADNGYDRVGLTTGKQQVERYSNEMRQNVDQLQFFPIGNQNNILISAKKGGKQTFSGTVAGGKFIDGPAAGKTVTEVLGKSMAKQIAEKKDGVIKGDDLTIGGEGMKAYYDEIYPAFFAKQSKKYNAKTGETTISFEKRSPEDQLYLDVGGTRPTPLKNGEEKIRYIDISPEMKGGVKKGQPLFTAAPIGGIGVGAGMQDQQQNSLNSFIK